MNKSIVDRNHLEFQLVNTGIDLVHKIFSLMECSPELVSNVHAAKAHELAIKWNETFIDVYSAREVK